MLAPTHLVLSDGIAERGLQRYCGLVSKIPTASQIATLRTLTDHQLKANRRSQVFALNLMLFIFAFSGPPLSKGTALIKRWGLWTRRSPSRLVDTNRRQGDPRIVRSDVVHTVK